MTAPLDKPCAPQIAALCNIVLIAEKGERAAYISSVLREVFHLFPAKLLTFTVMPKEEVSDLKIERSLLSLGGDGSLACESIDYKLPKEQAERIYFSLCRDLQTDRECYLLFGGTTEELLKMPEVARLASKVIVDSESSPSLREFAKDLLVVKENLGTEVADLNWSRILPWRKLLYNYFSDESFKARLPSLLSVEVEYNDIPSPLFCHPRAQGIYFALWLGKSLGKKFSSVKRDGGTLTLSFDNGFTVTLTPSNYPTIHAGKITRILMKFPQEASILFQRGAKNPKEILVDAADMTRCSLQERVDFSKEGTSYSIIPELTVKSSDQFLSLLPLIASFPEGDCSA